MIAPVVTTALLLLGGLAIGAGRIWRSYAVRRVPVARVDDGRACYPHVKR